MMNRKKYAIFVRVPVDIKRELCILNSFSKICPGSNYPSSPYVATRINMQLTSY